LGWRVIDNLAGGIARESKMGYVALTQRIGLQVAKDAELLREVPYKAYEWHFFPGRTGIGPSEPLRQALRKAGITIVLH
jgi:hypothetical protein